MMWLKLNLPARHVSIVDRQIAPHYGARTFSLDRPEDRQEIEDRYGSFLARRIMQEPYGDVCLPARQPGA